MWMGFRRVLIRSGKNLPIFGFPEIQIVFREQTRQAQDHLHAPTIKLITGNKKKQKQLTVMRSSARFEPCWRKKKKKKKKKKHHTVLCKRFMHLSKVFKYICIRGKCVSAVKTPSEQTQTSSCRTEQPALADSHK